VSSKPHVHRFAAAGHHKNNLPHDGTFQLAMRLITAEGLHTPEIMKKNEIAMTTDGPWAQTRVLHCVHISQHANHQLLN
jgi:hypothetical protein